MMRTVRTPRGTSRSRSRAWNAKALALAATIPVSAHITAHAAARPDAPADFRIDPATGRDTQRWPRSREFDITRMVLAIDLPDPSVPAFTADLTLTARAIARPQTTLFLDAGPALTISAITADGRDARFHHDADAHLLRVDLPAPALPDADLRLVIRYTARDPGGPGRGMNFVPDDPDTPEFDPAICTQGQPRHNHLWFPCHDEPDVRLATELIVTLPEPFEAIANGRLISQTRRSPANVPPAGDQALDPPARITYHWRHDQPHAPYLVVLAIGRFDRVELGGPDSARPGLPMPVFGPLGSADALRKGFAATPAMLAHFEQLFDEPYPFDKHAQIITRALGFAGAMENSSAVTYEGSFAFPGAAGFDPVIAHELAHQWFGNLLTCASWPHVWIHEAFAGYAEALWIEHVRGHEAAVRSLRRQAARITLRTNAPRPPRLPDDRPMVTRHYDDPDELFAAGDGVYTRGPIILHMLRERLGDEIFWTAVRGFIDSRRFRTADTDDLRRAFEDASGQSLERFFQQWVHRPGLPRLRVKLDWIDGPPSPDTTADRPGRLRVRVDQTQPIDARNPAYAFHLPIHAAFSPGQDPRVFRLAIDRRRTDADFPLPSRPSTVLVDPRLSVLAAVTLQSDFEQSPDTAEQADNHQVIEPTP